MPNINKMSKKDPYRALLSEFLPAGIDSLLPFSNDIFYKMMTKQTIISKEMLDLLSRFKVEAAQYYEQDKGYTIPYTYFVKKNDSENRELKLIHPLIQLSFVNLYEKYGNYISGICSNSSYSIRCPNGISSSLHVKDAINNENIDDLISLNNSEKKYKYYKSYYTYKGYSRLHHFYNSKSWKKNEKKFSYLLKTDISSCFPRIYTHSMSWALTSKEYAKDSSHKHGNLWNDFDILMRRSNYNETNGIPVGAEVSRVFAELILQAVDKNLAKELAARKSSFSDHDFINGENYQICRYVDDYFIYANNEDDLKLIRSKLSKCLLEFNLSLSDSKTILIHRPFQTKKTNATLNLNELMDKFVLDCKGDTFDNNFSTFLSKVKAVILDQGLSYSDVSNYIHGVIERRLHFSKKNKNMKFFNEELILNYNFVKNIIEMVFFFYHVSLTGSSGAKVAKLLFKVRDRLKKENVDFLPLIDQLIIVEIEMVLTSYLNSVGKRLKLPVEIFNMLIVASKIQKDNDSIISESVLLKLFEASEKSYFELVAFQYYIKNDQRYEKMQKKIRKQVLDTLKNFDKKNTVHFLLAFDFSSCPYLDIKFKKEILAKACKSFNIV